MNIRGSSSLLRYYPSCGDHPITKIEPILFQEWGMATKCLLKSHSSFPNQSSLSPLWSAFNTWFGPNWKYVQMWLHQFIANADCTFHVWQIADMLDILTDSAIEENWLPIIFKDIWLKQCVIEGKPNVSEEHKTCIFSLAPASDCLLLELMFGLFLKNVGFSLIYSASHPASQYHL